MLLFSTARPAALIMNLAVCPYLGGLGVSGAACYIVYPVLPVPIMVVDGAFGLGVAWGMFLLGVF